MSDIVVLNAGGLCPVEIIHDYPHARIPVGAQPRFTIAPRQAPDGSSPAGMGGDSPFPEDMYCKWWVTGEGWFGRTAVIDKNFAGRSDYESSFPENVASLLWACQFKEEGEFTVHCAIYWDFVVVQGGHDSSAMSEFGHGDGLTWKRRPKSGTIVQLPITVVSQQEFDLHITRPTFELKSADQFLNDLRTHLKTVNDIAGKDYEAGRLSGEVEKRHKKQLLQLKTLLWSYEDLFFGRRRSFRIHGEFLCYVNGSFVPLRIFAFQRQVTSYLGASEIEVTLIDGTTPHDPRTPKTYTATGRNLIYAVVAALRSWDSWNRYPPGKVRFRLIHEDLGAQWQEFDTDGESFGDSAIKWLDRAAMAAAVVGAVALLFTPVPGARVGAALVVRAAMIAAAATSTPAAAGRLAMRHAEGIHDVRKDAIDVLTIVSNLLMVGAMNWGRGIAVQALNPVQRKAVTYIFFGQIGTDVMQGALIGAEIWDEYIKLRDDPNLTPLERLQGLKSLMFQASLNGLMMAVSVTATARDLRDAFADPKVRAHIEDPDGPTIDLTEDAPTLEMDVTELRARLREDEGAGVYHGPKRPVEPTRPTSRSKPRYRNRPDEPLHGFTGPEPRLHRPPQTQLASAQRKYLERGRLDDFETEHMLDHAVWAAREVHYRDKGFTPPEVQGACGAGRANVTLALLDLGIPPRKIHVHQILELDPDSVIQHAFTVVEMPNGKSYIVDVTYRQFFNPNNTRPGGTSSYGVKVRNTPHGNQMADEIMDRGYVELDDTTRALYVGKDVPRADLHRSTDRAGLDIDRAEMAELSGGHLELPPVPPRQRHSGEDPSFYGGKDD